MLPLDPKQSFPALEAEVLSYWKENDTFKKSLEQTRGNDEYVFYDGPPFATGTPHYGHILAGAIKDAIGRYQTMQGKYVERRFGWDCHGVPIEQKVEKKLGVSGKQGILSLPGWVHQFNEECRNNVFVYTDEWRKVVEKTGRWVDMDNDWKTMDTSFMESVWQVFKRLHEKGLIYESYRVVPYSVGMETPLSNFEVNQGYQDKQDKAVTVKFHLVDSDVHVLAWTTTPWTLPANLGLAVGEDLMYAEIRDNASGERYILASDRIASYYKKSEDFTLLREFPWSELIGLKYEPLFNDFTHLVDSGNAPRECVRGKNTYTVVAGHHVTTDSGTGVVHIAPAYGEDDFQIGKSQDLWFFAHIDDAGRTINLIDRGGEFVFDFNERVIEELKAQKKTVRIETITHSYPFCYRSGVPLIYRAISAWYVSVEKIREQMLAANGKTSWTPDSIRDGRFGKWLEGARDWNISRNRYWGTPLPVWRSEDRTVVKCIGSIEEMYELNKPFGDIENTADGFVYKKTGAAVDLHKHFVDEIKLRDPETGKDLTRITEVLDCWFESGSMPYASRPEVFQKMLAGAPLSECGFPGDFIAEGLDQTRGWFYTLMVLSTALFGEPAFKNVIVNGIILAEDGKKMSKSLNNYPDPKILLDTHGADALRLFLLGSQAVKADDLRFSENAVAEMVKQVILPLWNSAGFLATYANIDGWKPTKWSITYIRHGETDANKEKRISDGYDNSPLNETGRGQAKKAGEAFKKQGKKFTRIISSPALRAQETARIIAGVLGFTSEIETDGRIIERNSPATSGSPYIVSTDPSVSFWGQILASNDGGETAEEWEKRIAAFYDEMAEKYPDDHILIVAHGGSYRMWRKYVYGLSLDEACAPNQRLGNCGSAEFPMTRIVSSLDRYMLSELSTFVARFTDGMDHYDLQSAVRSIADIVDTLTNWYIRRSRRRFWVDGLTDDKKSAYETLHRSLTTICQVIAPIAPFISDALYQRLTGEGSVHLTRFPSFRGHEVARETLSDMRKVRDLVTLGLAARAKKKIRVRQPLQSVTIGESLSDEMRNILAEELNVKEVKTADMSLVARQIVKPFAKILGPRLVAKVQSVIVAAKNGQFTSVDGGVEVDLGSEKVLLQSNEYETAWEPLQGIDADVEGGFGTVIALDTHVSQDLQMEGAARDLIRTIQDMRKEALYQVMDRIQLSLTGDMRNEIVNAYGAMIEKETLSKIQNSLEKADLVKEIESEVGVFTVGVGK